MKKLIVCLLVLGSLSVMFCACADDIDETGAPVTSESYDSDQDSESDGADESNSEESPSEDSDTESSNDSEETNLRDDPYSKEY